MSDPTLEDKLHALFYSKNNVNWPGSLAEEVAALVAEHYAPGEDAVAFVKRLVGAWDCCGTCAGGVLAERDRAVVAAERERADADAAKIAAVRRLAESAPHSTPIVSVRDLIAALGGEAAPRPLPLHRTEAGYPNCSTCDGGGCPDCTDPA